MAETFQDVPFSWGPAALEPSERHLLASETHLVEVLRKSELRVPWSSWAWRHDVLSYLQDLGGKVLRVRWIGDGLGLFCFFCKFLNLMALNFDRSFWDYDFQMISRCNNEISDICRFLTLTRYTCRFMWEDWWFFGHGKRIFCQPWTASGKHLVFWDTQGHIGTPYF